MTAPLDIGGISWPSVVAMVVVAVFGSGGGVALFTVRATIKKLKREASKADVDSAAVVSETALTLLEPMRIEIDRLKSQVTIQSDEITRLTGRVRDLSRQVDSMTDRLDLAQRLLSDAGIPFPPHNPNRGER